ncbi:MAG: four helix bundle protein [Gemmatimonadetes bacterium]|nr:four helix bundle protein [Gemmatimonadota bacterium]
MQIYKKLTVWQKSHELTLRVYRVSAGFHAHGHSALAGQMRRAAASVSANIAEGTGRSTSAQFANFLQQALGSARELDYHLLLARDLELLSTTDHATLEARTDQVTRMLVALRRTVHDRALTHPPRKARKTGKSPGPQA